MRRRSHGRRFIAGAGVAAAAVLADRGAGVAAVGVEPGASYFTPVTPTRVCDTRRRFGAIELGGGTRRVRIAGNLGVPSDAVAVVATITAVGGPVAPNHLRVFPAGTARPEVSAVNIPDTESAIANLVTVKLGTSGSAKGAIDLYSPRFTHVVVDVQGVYRPTSWPVTAGRVVAFDEARRAWDSRGAQRERPLIPAGSSTWVNLSWIVPRDAEAVIANLTFVRPVSRGYLTAYPRPPRPEASNVNGLGGQVRAVAIQTKLHYDPARQQVGFYVYNSVATHILVDVGGYVTGESAPRSSDGLFVPINPIRLLDTRKLTGNQRRLWPGWTRDVQLPSGWRSKAQAVTLNLGAVTAMAPGYFTMLPAGTPRPTVSTLNASVPGMNIANGSITRTSRNGVACFSSSGSHIILDVTGWFTGRPSPATVSVANPPPPPANLPWTLSVPRMGVTHRVYAGSPLPIVNRGDAWHWPNTGNVGYPGASIGLFAHRTEGPAPWRNGGVYRFQERLQNGDIATITTDDGRRFRYRYVGRTLTSDDPNAILRATRRLGGDTISLIACSRPDFSPTSLDYRIISTFELVDWTDIG